ncbi:MAG: hypothetical protein QOG80_567 [Pseudonocardiales bacterium]|jgi:hypothetical protein|nr:hypothetical protein [Pseudonocardiales bacterium]
MRVRRIAILAGAAVLTAGIGTVAPAAGASSPAESVTARVSSGPFTVQIQAQRAANAPATAATGTFSAHGTIAGITLFSVAGPVTCLDVRGNRMGLFYPITSSVPALFAQLHSGVFVTVQVSAAGRPLLLSFQPSPMSHASSCPPGLALLPITSGTAALTP